MKIRHVSAAALAVFAAAASADTIRIGSVSALTGPMIFDEAPRAAQAVFDRVNANGGINGQMIEYLQEDDRFDPATAAQAARRLVEEEKVIGNVGSASVLECTVNNAYYSRSGLVSLTGVGVDPACFSSPSIIPVNTGPYKGAEVTLTYLSEIAGAEKICVIFFDVPGQRAGYDAAIKAWSEATGNELFQRTDTLELNEDTLPYLLQARDDGCDAILYNGIEPQIVAYMRGVEAQAIDGITWAFLTPAYTATMPTAIGEAGEGIVANAEFLPFTSGDPALDGWLGLMANNDIPASAFAQAGYVAANLAVEAMQSIEGEITRESFAAAVRNIENYETPFVGNPMTVGTNDSHNPNFSSQFVVLRDGAWEVATDWVAASD